MTVLSRKSDKVLTLGIPKVDDVFPGFQRGDLAVLFGHPICKTLLFCLCVRCQLPPRKGGLSSRAVYIDGGNTFDPYGVSSIAREYGLEPRSVLEKILVSRAFTVYQLIALIFEKLEETLKQYRSRLVIVSDIIGLFLDKDVPKKEGRDLFMKMMRYLSELASNRQVIVVASYFPRGYFSRSLFFDAVLFGRAKVVVSLKKSKDVLKFILEHHPNIRPFAVDFPSNSATMDMFMET